MSELSEDVLRNAGVPSTLTAEDHADLKVLGDWLTEHASPRPATVPFQAGRESLKPLVRQLVAALVTACKTSELVDPADDTYLRANAGPALAAAKAQGFEP